MASVADGVQDRSVSIGRVFGLGFSTIGHNPVATIGTALLLGAVPSTLVQVGATQYSPDILASVGPLAAVVGSVITFVVMLAFALITQGALVRATLAESQGRTATFGECLATGMSVALPLLGLAIVTALGVGIGFILLFVPGVILFLMWSVGTPALVAEKLGVFGALGRSRQLTSGARWKIFGIELIILVVYWMFAGTLGVMFGTTASSPEAFAQYSTGMILISVIMGTAFSVVWATVHSALFIELRNWKEGPQAEALADVFA